MGRREELADEYVVRLMDADATDQVRVNWAWLWYLKERYAYDRHPAIFELCQKDPKDRGLANIVAHMREEITDRRLFQVLMMETAHAYVENLYLAGVLRGDVRESTAFRVLAWEVVLEGVKACLPLRGLDWDPEKDECPVANAAATTWLRYVDAIHEIYVLPRVRELKEVMTPISARERELTELDDFSEFALTDRERDDLEKDLDLSSSDEGGGLDARRP